MGTAGFGAGKVDDFMSDILRGENKIDTPARDCAFRHVWLPGRVELLRYGNASHFFDAAQRCRAIAIVAGDNDSDKCAAPVLG